MQEALQCALSLHCGLPCCIPGLASTSSPSAPPPRPSLQVEGTVRKEDDRRKRKRQEKAERLAAEEEQRRAEVRRLKNLKKAEIEEK